MPSKRRKARLKKAARDRNVADAFSDPIRASSYGDFATVPENFDLSHLRYQCSECGRKANIRACSGCMKAKYCSKDCQRVAYKRIHKKVCGKVNQVGFPTMEVLEKADGDTLALIYDEWAGSCSVFIGVVWNHVMGLSLSGSLGVAEATSIATTTARVLHSLDGVADRIKANNAIVLASTLSSSPNPQIDMAISSTALLSACMKHFLSRAPLFADCEYIPGQPIVKSTTLVHAEIDGLLNLLAASPSINLPMEDLVRWADVTVQTILDVVRAKERSLELEQSLESRRAAPCLSLHEVSILNYGKELGERKIDMSLWMLLRNLSFHGVAPRNLTQVTAAFMAEATSNTRRKGAIEFVQIWGTTASNLTVKCGADVSELKEAISQVYRSDFGIIPNFAG